MHVLIKHLTLRELIVAEAPSFAGSLVIAELFYKFGSFTLECVAFLATWYVLSSILRLFVRRAPLTDR